MSLCALRRRPGQSAVEFVMMAPVAMILLAVAIQYAAIGRVDLALGQMNYQGARYAAAHEGCDRTTCSGADAGQQAVQTYMLAVGASLFSSNSSRLMVSVTPAPRSLGQSLTVSSTFTLPNTVVFLPNPFFGIVWLPTQLTSSQTTMSQ
jgi:Flp pilus assembly protein TadG